MRRWTILAALALAGCSGMTFNPHAQERLGIDGGYYSTYTVLFKVACDSCRVEYGREGSTTRVPMEGGWTGSAYLGALRDGANIRVLLRVTPIGDETRVSDARIVVNGKTVKSGEGDDPGDIVSLRARIG